MRPIRIRNAARAAHGDQNGPDELEGFTFVDIVVGLLLIGIVAAIVVFAVAQATHRNATPSAPLKCSNAVSDEVAQVHVFVKTYEQLHDGRPPATLQDLKKDKLPVPKTPLSHAAGFVYNPQTGAYNGPCVTR